MQQFMQGMFGLNQVPRHKSPLDEEFTFGGYGPDGNPIAQGPPQVQPMQQSGNLAQQLIGPVMVNPARQNLPMQGVRFGSQDQAMSMLRQGPMGQGMNDDQFSNLMSHNGYDPTGKAKSDWEKAYGTGGVGGRWYQPLFSKAY